MRSTSWLLHAEIQNDHESPRHLEIESHSGGDEHDAHTTARSRNRSFFTLIAVLLFLVSIVESVIALAGGGGMPAMFAIASGVGSIATATILVVTRHDETPS